MIPAASFNELTEAAASRASSYSANSTLVGRGRDGRTPTWASVTFGLQDNQGYNLPVTYS
jgi:hypothetical protein